MATPTITVNIAVTAAGAQPTSPTNLWANLLSAVGQINPGYSVLPSGLVEDIASTDVGALSIMDSAVVEFINSLDPESANAWLLLQLGGIYGVPVGQTTNGSAFVVFTSNTPGFVIGPGFLVSDGSNQYAVPPDGGTIIGGGGTSPPTFVVATSTGIFPIPAHSINQLVSQPPVGSGITLSVDNPNAGTPQAAPQTEWDYRTQVLQAGLVSGQGNASMLKTLVQNVPGVQPRLVSVQLQPGRGWEVIVGGGDPYAVANAVYRSGIDLSTLVGSETVITAASKAAAAVITTNINHGFTNGQTGVVISGALGMTGINGTWTVTTTGFPPNQFSIPYNSTSAPTYTGGGTLTPNSGSTRNSTTDIDDYPDTYPVIVVDPPNQTVVVQLTYFTISPNIVSNTAVQQAGAPAIANFINAIPVGAPLNLNALATAFTNAVIGLFSNNLALISELDWTITIDGLATSPTGSTYLIPGDPESSFSCQASSVTITQG